MTLASVVTVTGCLLLFGVFMLFSVNLNYITQQVQSQCEIQAYINIDYTKEQAQALKDEIEKIPNVKEAVLETKDQAFENYKAMLGEDAVALDGLETEDFLRNSYKITLDDLRMSESLVGEVSKIEGVSDVRNRKDILDKIINVTDLIKSMSFYSMLLLSVIAIFIISNTIKLAVHAREKEIHIMKYVGATDWFIRWPFIIEGIIVGIIGAALAFLLTSVSYNYVYAALRSFLDIFDLRQPSSMVFLLISSLFSFGAVMGAAGSLIAVRRHLKV